jgi:hypothetical protein
MANPERGEMTLVAGEQTYTLRLTTNACCDLEDRSGHKLDDVFRRAYDGGIRDLRWLIWAALQDRHADQAKTPADAGRIIDEAGGIQGVLQQMIAFMKLNTEGQSKVQEVKPNGKDATADPSMAQAEASGDSSTSPSAPSA